MSAWHWLTKPQIPYTWRFVVNVGLRGLMLFALLNVLFALLDPMAALGRLSIYNTLVPGRLRLPYAENPAQSYNLSLQNLEALFAAHEISGASHTPGEFRIVVVGDSATWGVLLDPSDTLTGNLNALALQTPDGRRVRAFNLGYPVQSLFKDLLILDHAMRYRPDLVIWPVTLESFAPDAQLTTLLVRENPALARALIQRFGLALNPADSRFIEPDFLGKTLIGRRRALADWLRLQLYGLTWGITRVDQQYPRFYEPRMEDFPDDMPQMWHDLAPGAITQQNLAFDVLRAGVRMTAQAGIPMLIVNEPMFISTGQNSDRRYNYFYPRWAADSFRALLRELAEENGWHYRDLWNSVPASQFTDSAVHLTPAGSRLYADSVAAALLEILSGEVRAAQLRAAASH